MITSDKSILYIEKEKLSHQVIQHLGDHVEIKPYNSIFSDLRVFSLDSKSKRLWIDSRCNLALQESLGGSNTVFESLRSPIMAMKAIKCETELNGFRNCHIRDASALCNFFGWLENELIVNKSSNISEVDAAEKLESFRSVLDDYVGLSFDTISGFGSNSAIIHYKPRKESSKLITTSEIYLLDSGAQFKDGTTDVTRTVHFGEPSIQEKDAYTRVLKGHIQLDLSVFPNGTTGYILDAIARAPLWV